MRPFACVCAILVDSKIRHVAMSCSVLVSKAYTWITNHSFRTWNVIPWRLILFESNFRKNSQLQKRQLLQLLSPPQSTPGHISLQLHCDVKECVALLVRFFGFSSQVATTFRNPAANCMKHFAKLAPYRMPMLQARLAVRPVIGGKIYPVSCKYPLIGLQGVSCT